MRTYPTVTLATDDQLISFRGVYVEKLREQLIPIRDTLLKVFDGVPARSRGELSRLELGLTLTTDGNIAFVTGTTKPSITLTLETRPRSPRSRSKTSATKQPDVIEVL